MQKITVDVAVIGAGTAGVTAFHALKGSGRKVALIDRGPLGTTCARVGCMPSKAALHAGMRWKTAKDLPAGALLSAAGPAALWAHARQTRDALVRATVERTRQTATGNLIMGEARFVAPGLLQVGAQQIEAAAFIVATGSRPIVPKAFADLSGHVLTTDTLFELEALPRKVGILGLGAIGLELGLALSRLDVDVVAADQRAGIGGIQDPAILARALSRFQDELPMWLGESVEATLQGGEVRMCAGERRAAVERLLLVAGRTPNIEALNLSAAGVAADASGHIRIDPDTLRAADAPIFFAGDVQPDRPLMHEAVDEGRLAAEAALAHLDGRAWTGGVRRVPVSILFSDPDVCSVGMGHEAAMQQDAVVGVAEGAGDGRSMVLGAQENLLRIYVARGSGALLGASMILTHGEHLAHLLAWAIQARQSVADLLAMPYYHPTIEEMLQSALKSAASQLDLK